MALPRVLGSTDLLDEWNGFGNVLKVAVLFVDHSALLGLETKYIFSKKNILVIWNKKKYLPVIYKIFYYFHIL